MTSLEDHAQDYEAEGQKLSKEWEKKTDQIVWDDIFGMPYPSIDKAITEYYYKVRKYISKSKDKIIETYKNITQEDFKEIKDQDDVEELPQKTVHKVKKQAAVQKLNPYHNMNEGFEKVMAEYKNKQNLAKKQEQNAENKYKQQLKQFETALEKYTEGKRLAREAKEKLEREKEERERLAREREEQQERESLPSQREDSGYNGSSSGGGNRYYYRVSSGSMGLTWVGPFNSERECIEAKDRCAATMYTDVHDCSDEGWINRNQSQYPKVESLGPCH